MSTSGAVFFMDLCEYCPLFRIDEFPDRPQNYRMGQAQRPACPECGAFLILALPPGGKGPRTLRCMDCEQPDPFKTDRAKGWLKSELQPPK
jgi:hypothetical protein